MSERQPAAAASPPSTSRRPSPLLITLGVVAALLVGFYIFSQLYADWLWYDQLGFVTVLQTQWISVSVMFLIGFVAMAAPLWLVIRLAFRNRPVYAQLNAQLDRYQELIEPIRQLGMWLIPIAFGLFAGVAASSRWETAQLWLNRQSFGLADPQFGFDAGFFVFELPFYQQVVAFALAVLFACGVASIVTAFLYGSIRFTGREMRVARSARIQIAIIVGLYILVLGVSIWLGQYATAVQASTGGTVPTGVGYTEANAIIPGAQILAGIAGLVAVFFFITAAIGRWRLPMIGTALLIVSSLVVGLAYPAIVQRFQVDPSARSLEAQYIANNIEWTRIGYDVANVDVQPYDAVTDAEPGALLDDAQTTANIRIIDPALVTDAFANLQEYRQYYQFPEVLDVDRYEIDGVVYDTVVAVRELDAANLDDSSWYNEHIVFTHGYGFVAAYGNQTGPEGQPVFLQSGIPTAGALGEFEPRIYFGESSPLYSIVGGPDDAAPLELDYPMSSDEGSGNAETTFAGDGGPQLSTFLERIVYAIKFQSEQIILSDAVTSESQILYNRDPRERVELVAPWLTVDSDAYPAVVDGQVVWIVDGYTTSNDLPYSTQSNLAQIVFDQYTTPSASQNQMFNYIRNSVKAVVNAYDGSVTLYAWDIDDPILQAWMQVYPGTVQPMSEMSADLLSHVRYPVDMFKAQRYILGDYHVSNPGTFYSGDDQWVTPNEPTAASGTQAPLQPPYYLTMAVGEQESAFTLYSTYIPRDGRNVLYGYLAVNADAGSTPGEVSEDYGQLTLLQLPKDTSVPGPGQVQNNFNTDNDVSGELNILRQGASEVILGNLLTVPVGGGLLYVQPVYLQSTGETSFPVLRRILVAFGDQIAFEPTLDQALDALFGGDSGAPPIDTDGTVPPESEVPDTGEPTSVDAQIATLLQQAGEALAEREEAYRNNDLVAAAEADARMQELLAQAIALTAQQDAGTEATTDDTGETEP